MEAGIATVKRERAAVWLLCVLGAAHVFIFAAAFPFFSPVDEPMHFDLAVRYSQGDLPRSLTPVTEEALPFMVIYGTPEYLSAPELPPAGVIPPPPWKQPVAAVHDKLAAKAIAYRQVFQNHEAASPPLYYALAGGWWRVGRLLNLDGAALLYWLRFLNIPLVAGLVWLGWRTARQIFPENRFVRLAVPALIAFLPQSTFYAINNDILTPVTFGAAYILLLRFFAAPAPPRRLAAAAGLALAGAFLTKATTLPLLAAAGIFILLKLGGLARTGKWRAALPPLLVLSGTAAGPMAAWMAWCKINFGDFTGSSLKIHFLGWTSNPAGLWLAHPLFSGPGLWFFLKHNLTTFWQGEMLWHRLPLAFPWVDWTYLALTFGALGITLFALLRRPPAFTASQRSALWLGFSCVAASVAFFAVLSVSYDFQDCFYPSRAHPFFISGRLLLGLLVPFLILFACGLDRLTRPFGPTAKCYLLPLLLGFMLASEIAIDWPVFSDSYNWFHC